MITDRNNLRLSPAALSKINGTTRVGELKRIKRGVYGAAIRDGRRWFVPLFSVEAYRGQRVTDEQLQSAFSQV